MDLKNYVGKTIMEIELKDELIITFIDGTKLYVHGYTNNSGDDCLAVQDEPFENC